MPDFAQVKLKMDRAGRETPGTGQRSKVGLTPFSSHITHVEKSKASVKPGQVSGLQEEIGAHRGKSCVKSSQVYL